MDEIEKGTDPLEAIHGEAISQFDEVREAEREDRWLAEEDYEFVSGEQQWPETIREQRETDGKPCLQFNRLPVFIAHVMGDARRNRPAIKVSPVDSESDPDTAEVLEGVIRHIESDSDSDIAYLSALQQCCEGARGHWRVLTDYVDDTSFDQEIKIDRIWNPLSVYWDHNAKDPNKLDAEWCFVTDWITTEAFDKDFPDEEGVVNWEDDNIVTRYGGWFDSESNKVRVAEYWCKKHTPEKLYMLSDGRTVTELPEGIEAQAEREVMNTTVVRYLLSGDRVLEGPREFPSKYIPIVSIFGPEEYVDGRVRHRSMIRHAKDAQRMYNYWQSVITEKIALAPSVPYIGTVEMFKGLETQWRDANNSKKSYLPYNADNNAPGAKPERSQPAFVNVAEIQQSAQSIDDMKATIGMFDASLGATGNETSGRAILARQSEGDRATFSFIDNLARGIEHTGRILVDMIPRVYDTERVLRVLGEDGNQTMVSVNQVQVTDALAGVYQVLNDLSVGKYDVRVSMGPSYQTRRMEAADSMMAFVQAFPQAAPLVGDLIAKNMDWPGAEEMSERLKALVPPQLRMDDMDPEEEEALQAQMAQQQESDAIQQASQAVDIRERAAKAAKEEAMSEKIRAEVLKVLTEIKGNEQDIEAQELENAIVATTPAEQLSITTGG